MEEGESEDGERKENFLYCSGDGDGDDVPEDGGDEEGGDEEDAGEDAADDDAERFVKLAATGDDDDEKGLLDGITDGASDLGVGAKNLG